MAYKYKRIFMPNHPTSMADGWIKEHRYVAEIKLGRLLKQEEVVHHIDEDKFNNSPDNLIVFKTNADHSAFHMGCEAVLDGDVYWCPDKALDKILCPICKTNYMDGHSAMCVTCSAFKQRKVERPSKDELLELIKVKPFTQIAKIYGVCDNTIRKWCKGYNLPYKKKDILNL